MTGSHVNRLVRIERKLVSNATRKALRFFRPARKRPRLAPGSQPHAMAIPADAQPIEIEWMRYTQESLDERSITDVSELRPALDDQTVDWIHVRGVGDEEQVRALGEVFGIHPLALADTVNVPQRSKVDTYDEQQLIVLRMACVIDRDVDLQQLSLVVGPSWVVSFVEHAGDAFDPVRARLRTGVPTIRRSRADYLAYALIDAVVDGFFPVVDMLSEILDELEEAAIGDPQPRTLARIHAFRRLLIQLSRTERQQRDAVLVLSRQEDGPFGVALRPYLRDVEDHAIHVLDSIETLREMSVGVMDIYLSSVNNRTNDVMKTLTVMASLFIPLTFISGVYGMNFDYMPELHWRWGYLGAWIVMLAVAAVLIGWFAWRGWLGALGSRSGDDDS